MSTLNPILATNVFLAKKQIAKELPQAVIWDLKGPPSIQMDANVPLYVWKKDLFSVEELKAVMHNVITEEAAPQIVSTPREKEIKASFSLNLFKFNIGRLINLTNAKK